MRVIRNRATRMFVADSEGPYSYALALPPEPSVVDGPLLFGMIGVPIPGEGEEAIELDMTRTEFLSWVAGELEEDPDALPTFYVEDEPQTAGRGNGQRKRRIRGRDLDELRAEKRLEMEAAFEVQAQTLLPSPWLAAALDHGDQRIQQLAEMGRKLQARYREIDRANSKEDLDKVEWADDDDRRY